MEAQKVKTESAGSAGLLELIRVNTPSRTDASRTVINGSDVLTKLQQVPIFQGIDKKAIALCMKKHRLYPAGVTLIQEWAHIGRRYFYLLIWWKVGVYRRNAKIAEVRWVDAIGEMGFFTGKRMATVIVEEASYIAQITEEDLDAMGPEAKALFERNLKNEYEARALEIYELLNESERKMLSAKRFIYEQTRHRISELGCNI